MKFLRSHFWISLTVFAASVALLPGLRSVSAAPKTAILLFALPLLLVVLKAKPSAWGLALLGYSFASLLWAPIFPAALDGLLWAALLCAALSLPTTLDKIWSAVLAALAVNVFLAGTQYAGYGLELLATAEQPAGTFVNKNFLGEFAALACALALQKRSYVGMAMGLVGVGMSQSGGAGLGMAMAAMVLAWPRAWPLVLAGICGAAAWAGLFHSSFVVRLELWSDALQGASLWGHGIGQFYSMFPYYSSDTLVLRHEHAHSLPIELLFELGLFGLVWSLGIFAVAYWRGGKARPALVCLGAISLVGFPLWNPATLLLGGIVLGSALREQRKHSRVKPLGECALFRWATGWRQGLAASRSETLAAERRASPGRG